jgi:hypothetical protein
MHYQRWLRNGDPVAFAPERKIDEDTILNRVCAEPNSGCWIWDGARDGNGYGKVVIGGKHVKATRISWQVFRGPIPSGLYICHTCDNPTCVNPDHLYPGTPAQNSADAARRGRTASGERNANAKLTRADVVAIRAARDIPRKDIALKYGVSDVLVGKIQRGLSWRSV